MQVLYTTPEAMKHLHEVALHWRALNRREKRVAIKAVLWNELGSYQDSTTFDLIKQAAAVFNVPSLKHRHRNTTKNYISALLAQG